MSAWETTLASIAPWAKRLRRQMAARRGEIPPLIGHLELVTNHQAAGWVMDFRRPGGRLTVEILCGDQVIGAVEAHVLRPDLISEGFGDGRHGFDLRFEQSLPDADLEYVHARVRGENELLPRHAAAVRLVPAPRLSAEAPDQRLPKFRSRFGGLWTDLSHAPALAQGKRDLGRISAEEHDALTRWIEDGYVILPGAADPALCDAVIADMARAGRGELELVYREVSTEAGDRLIPAHERFDRLGRSQGKLIDLYQKSEAARALILNERVLRFLTLVFERPAIAFQSLAFTTGSEQALHQDTAFVPVSSPMELAAAWVALEDVVPGSGELMVVPGSHAIPEFLFEGKTRSMPLGSREKARYGDYLLAQCARAGLEAKPFLARKGDVLIWSADLVHGGASICDPRLTRRSLVAHYCPRGVTPDYAAGLDLPVTSLSPLGGTMAAPRGG